MSYRKPIPFNPEITDFFLSAGFEVPKMAPLPNGLMFIRNDTLAVQFWNDKIQVNEFNGIAWVLTKSFQGFDRTNVNKLMMLLDVMDVLPLKEVKRIADREKAIQYDFKCRTNLQTSHF